MGPVTAAQKRSPRSKSVTFITMQQRNFPIAIAPWVGQFSCGLVTAFIKRSRLKPPDACAYFGSIFVILLPCRPSPAISPWLKMNA